MDQTTFRDIRFLKPLVTEPVDRAIQAPWLKPHTTKSRLFCPFIVSFRTPQRTDQIIVPAGYITDWASIPKVFWLIYPPSYAEARRAAVIHDYIYSHLYTYYPKSFADHLLYAIMAKDQAKPWACRIFYQATHWFGRGGWQRQRTLPNHYHWAAHHAKYRYTMDSAVTHQAPAQS